MTRLKSLSSSRLLFNEHARVYNNGLCNHYYTQGGAHQWERKQLNTSLLTAVVNLYFYSTIYGGTSLIRTPMDDHCRWKYLFVCEICVRLLWKLYLPSLLLTKFYCNQ